MGRGWEVCKALCAGLSLYLKWRYADGAVGVSRLERDPCRVLNAYLRGQRVVPAGRGAGIAPARGRRARSGASPAGRRVVPNRETRALASPPATPDFAELAASRVRLGRPCSAQPRPAFGAGSDCAAVERFRRQTRRNLPAVGVSDSEAGADRRPVRQPDNECRAFRCAKGRP